MEEKNYYKSIQPKILTALFILLLIIVSIFSFFKHIFLVGILSVFTIALVVFLSRKQWSRTVQLKINSSGITTKDHGLIKWSDIEFGELVLSGTPTKNGGLFWLLILQDSEKRVLLEYNISVLNSSKVKIENALDEFWIKIKKDKRLKFNKNTDTSHLKSHLYIAFLYGYFSYFNN